MELLSVVTSLLSITETVLNVRDKVKGSDKKDEAIEWLRATADLLESAAQDLKNGIYPHAKCAQMNYFLTKASDILILYMSQEEATQLRDLVRESYQIEKLYGQLQASDPQVKVLNLTKIDEAVGTFRGAADYLKVR